MRILFILQNAYRSEKYQFRNHEEWKEDLMRSHTGRRLQEMIPETADAFVVNASPQIGTEPQSMFHPDPAHIKKMVRKYNPDVVCACGRMAQLGAMLAGLEFVEAPHPAWRALTKRQTSLVKTFLY